MVPIALRPARADDSEFCFRLHKASMGEVVTAIWGWDEQLQREHHERVFRPGHWQIITADGTAIGMIDIDYRPDEIYLGRIEIDPGYQGRGIGGQLISALIGEARQKGQELVLDVFVINYRARALYRRLGLTEVARHGEGELRIRMRSKNPACG